MSLLTKYIGLKGALKLTSINSPSALSPSKIGSVIYFYFNGSGSSRTFLTSGPRPALSFDFVKEIEPNIKIQNDHIITVPVNLKRRLDKKMERESGERFRRQKIAQESRKGRRSQLVIQCKREKFNHYLGQSYAKNSEIELASKSWHHHKAAGDWFTIRTAGKSSAFGLPEAPDVSFEDLGVKSDIIQRLNDNKAFKPTLIQQLAIPSILKGTNSLIAAETGCGKTLAYLIPLVQQMLLEKRRRKKRGTNEPLAIILVPSHELASQIYFVATKLTEGMGLDIRLVEGGHIGGKIKSPPVADMDLIISTVHVMSVMTTAGVYKMNKVQHVVLDEADTLLDDSFVDDVTTILHRFPLNPNDSRVVQLSLVSATLPKTVESSLDGLLPLDSIERISTQALHYVMPHVPQTFRRLKKSEKPAKLLEIVNKDVQSNTPIMIFCNNTKTCDWMFILFKKHGIPCICIHGETKPINRKGLLNRYQNGEVDVMICTDLGSRGLNTIRTGHVINYEFPMFTADYIHRCGRTGRVGSTMPGKVTNFITRRFEFEVVREIELSIRKEVSLGKVDANIKGLLNSRYGMMKPIIGDD